MENIPNENSSTTVAERVPSPSNSTNVRHNSENRNNGNNNNTNTSQDPSRPATSTSSRVVRRNWWRYITESFRSISRTSRVLLILYLFTVVVQIIVTSLVLVTSYDELCDRPLRLYLILYIVRVMLACPVNVYLYLNPRENRGRNGHVPTENERRRDGWIDRIKSFLDLFATFWFIIGNYLLFTTNTCEQTAPSVFFLSLAWVILGYIIITVPILVCLAVIFCLPCVLMAMRLLHVNDASGISGAGEDIIAKIPLVIYKAPDSTLPAEDDVASNMSGVSSKTPDTIITIKSDEPLQPPPKKHSRFKFSLNKKEKTTTTEQSTTTTTTTQKALQHFTIPNSEDAQCLICLLPYEDGEELRNLWCSHHFHKDCVDEWLRLNGSCPMCRADVTKAAQDQENQNKDNDSNDNGDGNNNNGDSGGGGGGGGGGAGEGSSSVGGSESSRRHSAENKV